MKQNKYFQIAIERERERTDSFLAKQEKHTRNHKKKCLSRFLRGMIIFYILICIISIINDIMYRLAFPIVNEFKMMAPVMFVSWEQRSIHQLKSFQNTQVNIIYIYMYMMEWVFTWYVQYYKRRYMQYTFINMCVCVYIYIYKKTHNIHGAFNKLPDFFV